MTWFDRHVVAGDDDAFQEKPHEPLATGEVEVGEARARPPAWLSFGPTSPQTCA